MSVEAIKQFLAKYIIPVGAAALTTWLFATVHVFNLFGITEGQVDGEVVQSQPGDFYGGWITREIVGPFKGDPGTMGW